MRRAISGWTASGLLMSARQLGWLLAFSICALLPAWSADQGPNFDHDVAPILFKHCADCHRAGGIGASLPLVTYDSVRAHASAIKEEVASRKMPPWSADPAHSLKFRNDPTLSQQEIDTLVHWIDAGMQKGNDADLPAVPAFSDDWAHPKGTVPDLVIPLPDFHLPASGEIPYVKYLAKVPFSDDKWIAALQVLPGNRAVVHHMAITEVALDKGVTPADLDRLARVAEQLGLPSGSVGLQAAVHDPVNASAYDMLGVYTPGTTIETYDDGAAKLLRGGANMYLNFNIHYQTTGRPENDKPSIGFWFRASPPRHQLFRVPASGQTLVANGRELLTDTPGPKAEGTDVAIPPIPANTENYELIGITGYTEPVTIYQFQPHAHLRGKDFQYVVVLPDGREESVLSVPDYNFHWQLAYELETPLHLPAGSKLVVVAHYDNSTKNQRLLHAHHGGGEAAPYASPDREVHFREANQSWDEMFTPFIQYSIDGEDPAAPVRKENETPGTLEVAEVVGCLAGAPGNWTLTKSSAPERSATQSTTSVELKEAATRALGDRSYVLLGADFFGPGSDKEKKLAVKGVLIDSTKPARINVTSLETVNSTCH